MIPRNSGSPWRWAVGGLLLAAMFALAAALAGLWQEQKACAQDTGRGVSVRIRGEDGRAVDLYRGSYALVIAAGDYRAGWPKLPGAARDAAEVQAALEKQGFAVTPVRDPGHDALVQAVDAFVQQHGMEKENRLLVYFAGHGHTQRQAYGEEMGYIVPVDAPLPAADPSGFLARAVDMQQVEVWAKRIQSKHALFLFDSCFSGAIFALTRAVPEAIGYKTAEPVRQFITSGGADEPVPDRSVFKEQFLEGIGGGADRNRDGYVTGTELGEYLQDTVTNYSKGTQHPQYGKIRNRFLDKGDFVFTTVSDKPDLAAERESLRRVEGMAGTGSAPAGPAAPGREELARQAYEVAGKVNTEAAWREVATAFASTEYGKLAQQRLFQLEQERLAREAEAERQRQKNQEILRREQQRLIGEAWAATRRADTAAAYRSFVAQYGSDPLAAGEVVQARARQAELERAVAAPAAAGPVPAPAVVTVGSAGPAGQHPPSNPTPGARWADPVSGVEFVWIPPGVFQMGSPNSEADRSSDEGPRHWVKLSRGFWLGRTEVTQGQWRAVMGNNPARFQNGDNHPVEQVSWDDCQTFVRKLNGKAGRQLYRLPPEAEWEYACRAETGTAFHYGNSLDASQANFDGNNPYGGAAKGEYRQKTTPVASFRPNAWGLCDMHGNVYEWCQDWYGEKYYSTVISVATDPQGPASGKSRVLRGGSWVDGGRGCRSANRDGYQPDNRYSFIGIRLARDP